MKNHLKKTLGMLGIISLTVGTGCAGKRHLLAKGDVLKRGSKKCQIIGTRYEAERFLKFFVKAEAYYVLDCRSEMSHTLESITQEELFKLGRVSEEGLSSLGTKKRPDRIEPRKFDKPIVIEPGK